LDLPVSTRIAGGWISGWGSTIFCGGKEENRYSISTAEQFANMWRDSRKYGIWLHLITQSPSLIPTGILSSCNHLLVGPCN